ncbi:NADP-dependent oxidoreductase domain-containing protein [Suillus lakei]|nr:NADP-dependent oxidoreductase domain-containing protein [Suillus lakei]
MSTVQYRSLGKTGLKVSVPILGTMSFGTSIWASRVLNEEPSIKTMKAAWDLGIDTIDTTNTYSNGKSERLIAKFIEKVITFLAPRSKYIGLVASDPTIQSFFRPSLDKLPKYVNPRGLSRAAIFNAVDASLDRLETQYIDPLQIHRFDASVTPEETLKALHDLVHSGKVHYIGASSMCCWQSAMLNDAAVRNGWTNFVSMQDEYSLLYREEEREMLAHSSGVLARPVSTETTRINSTKGTPFERKLNNADATIVNRVEELSKKKNSKMSRIVLAWVASRVSGPTVGISSLRLHESTIEGIELTPEEMTYLEEPYEPKAISGHLALRYRRSCKGMKADLSIDMMWWLGGVAAVS